MLNNSFLKAGQTHGHQLLLAPHRSGQSLSKTAAHVFGEHGSQEQSHLLFVLVQKEQVEDVAALLGDDVAHE